MNSVRVLPFIVLLTTGFAVAAGKPTLAPRTAISLDQFLTQVESGNKNITAAKGASEGAGLRVSEASLLYSPVFEAEAQRIRDKRQSAFLSYDQFIDDTVDVGISQNTPWGLRGKFSYNLTQTGYEGLGKPIYYYGSPKVELALELWRNSFGSETRAQHEAIEANAFAAKFTQSFQASAARAAAENAYIQLAAARELNEVNRSSFDRANEIYDWNRRRSRLNLGEDSDLFQAEANLESLRLLTHTSADLLRSASRAFNQARGVDSDEVVEELSLPDPMEVKIPERAQIREDVRAAREQLRAAAAQAQLGYEKNQPTLELYGTYALNSQQILENDAIHHSFDAAEPTKVVGVRFSMPLAARSSSEIRAGYMKERLANETLANQKIFDQEVEWKDLVQRLADAKNRLASAKMLSNIQKKKALNERLRLKRGRTTTYQSLIFETDYNQAEYQRIQTQSEVLTLLAQMKTFGG